MTKSRWRIFRQRPFFEQNSGALVALVSGLTNGHLLFLLFSHNLKRVWVGEIIPAPV